MYISGDRGGLLGPTYCINLSKKKEGHGDDTYGDVQFGIFIFKFGVLRCQCISSGLEEGPIYYINYLLSDGGMRIPTGIEKQRHLWCQWTNTFKLPEPIYGYIRLGAVSLPKTYGRYASTSYYLWFVAVYKHTDLSPRLHPLSTLKAWSTRYRCILLKVYTQPRVKHQAKNQVEEISWLSQGYPHPRKFSSVSRNMVTMNIVVMPTNRQWKCTTYQILPMTSHSSWWSRFSSSERDFQIMAVMEKKIEFSDRVQFDSESGGTICQRAHHKRFQTFQGIKGVFISP